MSRMFKRTAILLWWLVAVSVISAALLLGMARLILPSLSNFRGDVEQWLSAYLQHSVSVQSLDLRWRGLGPQLTLTGLQIAEPVSDTPMLGVRQAYVDTDLWNLLTRREGIVRNIDLAGLELRVDIREDGSIASQGVELWSPLETGASNRPGDVLALLVAPRRITLSDVTLRLYDRRRDVSHVLDNISVRLRHIDDRHQLHALVPLPGVLGRQIAVDADFGGDEANLQSWDGRVYAALKGVQMHNWTAFVPDTPLQLASGALDGEVWLEWAHGSLQGAHIRSSIRDLTVIAPRADAGLARWRATEVAGDWDWQRTPDGWAAQIDRFRLREESGALRPQTSGRFEYRAHDQGGSLRGRWGYVNLADIAGWLPLAQSAEVAPAELERLAAMGPRGELHDVQFQLGAEGARALRLRFDNLSARAEGPVPGFVGLSGELQLAASRGRIALRSESFSLNYPRIFRQPLEAERLLGELGFDFADGLRLWSPRLEIANQHLQTVSRLLVDWRSDRPLFLDLQSDFRDGRGRFASRYVPAGVMPPKLTDWLDASIVDGYVQGGSALFYGPVNSFPFRGGDGVFQVDFTVRDTKLQYQPDWPALEQAAAHVRFSQAGLEVNSKSARIHGTELQQGRVRFADLQSGVMRVQGSTAGDLSRGLSFVRESPLQQQLGAFFADARGEGESVVSVDLTLPILDLAAFDIQGTVALDGASLVADAWQLDLDRLRGEVAFTNTGFSIAALEGRLHQRPVTVNAEPRSGSTRVSATGNFSAGALLGTHLPELAAALDGRADWRLEVDVPVGSGTDIEVRASSPLRGIAVNLPAPLRKPAADEAAFELRMRFYAAGEKLRMAFQYADLLSADLALSRDSADTLVIERGVARSGSQPAVLEKQQGLHITMDVSGTDLDGWWAFSQTFSGEASTLSVVERFNLRSDQAIFNGRLTGPLSFTVYRAPASWVAGIENQMISGSLDWPVDPQPAKPLRVNLQTLDLALFDPAEPTPDDAPSLTLEPQALPPMRIDIGTLVWLSTRFDSVRLVATPHDSNLTVDELSFDNGALRATGNGDWRTTADGSQRSWVEFRLESDDWGDGLTRLGYPKTMRNGDGRVSAELSWQGPFYQPALVNMQGNIRVRIDSGSLIGADPGLGRVVGLFSLQALPRRLALDFEDFLETGFDFDRVRGWVELSDGTAYTREMKMSGTVGRVEITGRSNLVEQTYAQQVVVTPNLSASLPLAGELVLPGSGITVLLLSAVLQGMGADLGKLGELKYTLTGRWDAPVFEQVVKPAGGGLEVDR